MKTTRSVIVTGLFCIALAVLAARGAGARAAGDTQPTPSPGFPNPLAKKLRPNSLPRSASLNVQARGLVAAPASALPQSANPAAIQMVTCPDDATQFGVPVTCGFVPVPVDWAHPTTLGKTNIYFELYRASSGPVKSAIVLNFGGPGYGTMDFRNIAFDFFGPNMDAHDILLIDERGRGNSGAIVCDDLDNGSAPFAQSETECAAQLGLAASRYGSGDIAQDYEAVRAALGYDKIDFFGQSYGGVVAEAYATRFGEHLRSLILDSPSGTPLTGDPLNSERVSIDYSLLKVERDCRWSPSCSTDHPFPALELDLLVWLVGAHPVEGDALDFYGNPTHVVIDEKALLDFIISNSPTGVWKFFNTGQILAAGTALLQGDPVPLLRLGAESQWTLEQMYETGDPVYYSPGANRATVCADAQEPWDWSAPPSVRQSQYSNIIESLPPWYYALFSSERHSRFLPDTVPVVGAADTLGPRCSASRAIPQGAYPRPFRRPRRQGPSRTGEKGCEPLPERRVCPHRRGWSLDLLVGPLSGRRHAGVPAGPEGHGHELWKGARGCLARGGPLPAVGARRPPGRDRPERQQRRRARRAQGSHSRRGRGDRYAVPVLDVASVVWRRTPRWDMDNRLVGKLSRDWDLPHKLRLH
jgi:pimeloyl-ACP methyl ester carboxylesterase